MGQLLAYPDLIEGAPHKRTPAQSTLRGKTVSCSPPEEAPGHGHRISVLIGSVC